MRAILQPFLVHLDDIETNVRLVGDLKGLAATSVAPTATRGPLARAAVSVRNTVLSQRTRETISLDGSLLFLSAQYEVTVRDLVEEMMRRKCQAVSSYSRLPEELRNENARLIGDLLRGRSRDPTIDQMQVVENFLRCHRVGRPVTLYVQGFSYHERNLSPDELRTMMKRAGVGEFWPSIGQDARLQAHLSSSGPDQTIPLARGKLSQFISDRNAISHRGASYTTVGESVLLEYVGFFRYFMPALVVTLEAHLAQFP